VVLGEKGRRLETGQLAVGILQRVGRQVGIQPRERLAQASLEDHVAEARIGALRPELAGGDVRPIRHGVTEPTEPGESGVLDNGFGEGAHGPPLLSSFQKDSFKSRII
jgi:hypothetical protein